MPLVYAHKVTIFAYAEDKKIYTESYFSDGTPARNSQIVVFDAKSKVKLCEGKTNNEGKFIFKIPKVTELKLVLNASMGHRAEFVLSEEEVKKAVAGVEKIFKKENTKEIKKNSEANTLDESEIEEIIGKVMDKKLYPIRRMIIDLEKKSGKPGLTEVLGGIGYIIGIMGIIMYFKSRKKEI
jgi:nickel transport protein